jgi:hypothetical protein
MDNAQNELVASNGAKGVGFKIKNVGALAKSILYSL